MELILVRHGESTANAARLAAGHVDVALTEKGCDQAARAGKALKEIIGDRPLLDAVSSPLQRAVDTARYLDLGVEPRIDPRWVEIDYGQWDGKAVADIAPELWQAWRDDIEFAPPGGESLASVGRRVREACAEIGYDDGSASPRWRSGVTVVVSHVSPIKAAVAWALGAGDEATWRMHVDTATITSVLLVDSGPVLCRFNQCF